MKQWTLHNIVFRRFSQILIIISIIMTMVMYLKFNLKNYSIKIYRTESQFQINSNVIRSNIAFNTLGMNGNESHITTLSTTLLMGDNSNNSSTDSEGKRKDICSSCNMHSFKILFNNERICDLQGNQAIDIIILILTSHKNRQQREAIRKTWLTYAKNNTANVRYAFLLGFTYDKTIRLTTYDEAKKYNDIIIEDFIDSYGNLTHKSMMAFRWATEFCSHATFVLKIDDDMWLNVPSLLASTQNHNKVLQNGVGGKYKSSQGPMRHGKWRASYKNYPNKLYPAFCAGPGYVTSMGVAKKIFDISKHVPFFHLEDVYIGLCVQKLNLKIYGLKGFNNRKVRYDPCLYKSQKVVTSHHITPRELLKIWSTNCSQTVKP